ncbi:MAG: ribonuclease III [Rikenellaceae bacterium]|nr:ribonuclease III [Rikenellaceae bacterium]
MFDSLRTKYYVRFSQDGHYYKMVDELFGFCPNNIELYKLALVHRSASVILPNGQHLNNERLEYLGDAIIESIVSDYIFVEFPEYSEGEMTKFRTRIVSRVALNRLAEQIGLDKWVICRDADEHRKNIAGDALEAMMGAIYLDQGYEFANRLFINNLIANHVNIDEISIEERDFKSRLLEWCQKSHRTLRFATSPNRSDSELPRFHSVVYINGEQMGEGDGATKKEAEQNAAGVVLPLVLSDEIGDYILDSIDSFSETHDTPDVDGESTQNS